MHEGVSEPNMTNLSTATAARDRRAPRAYVLRSVRGTAEPSKLLIARTNAGKLYVGTAHGNDMRIDDHLVSRRHLSVEVDEEGLLIEDVGSKNGTFISGMRIKCVTCSGGEIVRIGGVDLSVDVDSTEYTESPAELRLAYGPLLGASLAMRRLYRTCDELAVTASTLLIEGDPGTGKLALGRAIHIARWGTLEGFLELDASVVADDHEPVEGVRTVFVRHLDAVHLEAHETIASQVAHWKRQGVRVMASTRRDPYVLSERGAFSERLLEIICERRISLPPLSARRSDIMLLVEKFCHDLGYTSEAIPVRRLAELPRRDYPGNVAELQSLVRRMIHGELVDKRATSGPMPTIEEMGLVLDFRDIVVSLGRFADAKDEVVSRFEKAYVTFAVAAHGGHVANAAAASGLSARYFNVVRARSRTEP